MVLADDEPNSTLYKPEPRVIDEKWLVPNHRIEVFWYYAVNVLGLQKIPLCFEYFPKSKETVRSKRHQNSEWFRRNVISTFTDEFGIRSKNRSEIRDRTIKIKAPKKCNRCGSRKRLERDHIIPLSKGGGDEASNLQWLCTICHDYKTARDEIVYEINRRERVLKFGSDFGLEWRLEMWSYRLEALNRLNPVGQKHYVTYWDDPKTHWDYWGDRYTKRAKEAKQNTKLTVFGLQAADTFFTRVKDEEQDNTEQVTLDQLWGR